MTSYNIFFRDQREKILAERSSDAADSSDKKGSSLFEALGKMIAQRWKEASEDEKNRYRALAEKDTDRYRDEMIEYKRKETERQRLEKRKLKAAAAAAAKKKKQKAAKKKKSKPKEVIEEAEEDVSDVEERIPTKNLDTSVRSSRSDVPKSVASAAASAGGMGAPSLAQQLTASTSTESRHLDLYLSQLKQQQHGLGGGGLSANQNQILQQRQYQDNPGAAADLNSQNPSLLSDAAIIQQLQFQQQQHQQQRDHLLLQQQLQQQGMLPGYSGLYGPSAPSLSSSLYPGANGSLFSGFASDQRQAPGYDAAVQLYRQQQLSQDQDQQNLFQQLLQQQQQQAAEAGQYQQQQQDLLGLAQQPQRRQSNQQQQSSSQQGLVIPDDQGSVPWGGGNDYGRWGS